MRVGPEIRERMDGFAGGDRSGIVSLCFARRRRVGVDVVDATVN